ncbi:MAG: SAM-dependent methyltransferase, partial [Balneolaceae bacterium]
IRLLQNSDAGLLSEAWAPCVADPGANLVKMAHDAGYRVSPLTGPSSILLALMASGMNGQHFTFHGYLPIDQKMRVNKITDLEKESMMKNQTQIFMETPHRNMQLYNDILSACKPETQLCIASNLTMPDELIVSQPVYKWKEQTVPELQGKPSLFLIYSC